jgi:hypothetical protein
MGDHAGISQLGDGPGNGGAQGHNRAAFNAQRWILSGQLGPVGRRIRDRAGLAEHGVPAASGEALRGGAQGELRHRDLCGYSRFQEPTQTFVRSTQPPFDCPRR